MNSRIIDRPRDLEGNRKFLSPPEIEEPLYQCAFSVTIFSYRPNALIEVDIDGVITSTPGGYPYPRGVTIPLPAQLVVGQEVRARQSHDGIVSDWTPKVTVKDHSRDYPSGPPRPVINPPPVYQCGVRTGVGNLLSGGRVWITANAATVGEVKGCSEQQGVNVSPAYSLGQRVRAWFEICDDPSPPSVQYVTGSAPNPLPAPSVSPMYESGRSVTIGNVVNGAVVTLYRDSANIGSWPCWGGSITLNGISPSFSLGENFTATQLMCPGDPESPAGSATVEPCSSLPAPSIGPVQAGDTRIIVTNSQPDTMISVWVNGAFAGASGPSIVNLDVSLKIGDVIIVVQDLDGCISQLATEVIVGCVNAPVGEDPTAYNLFPVGIKEFKEGDVKGSVYYPAQDDGEDEPFNDRRAETQKSPIVFMAHGNHDPADPSYLGYNYFQNDLAKMGIIAVSIDCNDLNGFASGVQNIVDRADRIISTIAYFQSLDSLAGSNFNNKINFGNTGLMGHSRGGDAVVMVPGVLGLAGVSIKSVLSLAPTNFNYWSGLPTVKPEGYPLLTILPAGDGDVVDNNGAQFYDAATPAPFKSQVYAHFTNHNFFNRQWLNDDSLFYSQPAVSTRGEHENILSSYGCALYRATLLGHDTSGYYLGRILPPRVMTENVFLGYELEEPTTIDNFEDGNTITENSLNESNSIFAGLSVDEYRFDRPGTGNTFNSSFYGLSIGMVAEPVENNGVFRSALPRSSNLRGTEIWIRCAEVTDGSSVSRTGTGFGLGVEDGNGVVAWIDSNQVGGLARPYARNSGMIKTMLSTLRFRTGCFQETKFDIENVVAIQIKLNRSDQKAIAFDDLQIYKGVVS